jgi:site-specific recombinase XerC
VFGDGSLRTYQHSLRNFELARKKAATKLGNPRLMRISFRPLRRFKATMEYQKTRDILHVMSILGHGSIKNTLVYTHLVNFQCDEYVCKVCKSIDDSRTLVENGFDYVTETEGMKLFRKRK